MKLERKCLDVVLSEAWLTCMQVECEHLALGWHHLHLHSVEKVTCLYNLHAGGAFTGRQQYQSGEAICFSKLIQGRQQFIMAY